ncbi:MAG TPA: MAPEG family protein [Rhizomicrobium sp.]|nr:MAPEG family protein [Rhizomicrobium sp.]
MASELYWLTLTVLMTALFWIPYVLERMVANGLWPTLAGTYQPARPGWAERAIKAHGNAVENLVLFAPAVLVAHAVGVSTPATQAAAAVYFFARLTHFAVYVLGVPVVRTLAFAAGWAALIVIVASVLGWR